MPGKSPHEAFKAFVDPLRAAIACVARAKLSHSEGGSSVVGVEHRLFLNRAENVPLKGTIEHQGRQVRLELGVRMRYQIIEDPTNGPYRITTLAYDHMLILSSGEVLMNFHWHPAGSSHERAPHLHLGSSQLAKGAVLTNKLHLPTGRVSVERVIRAAIELGVEPIDVVWEQRLDETERPFLKFRTWG